MSASHDFTDATGAAATVVSAVPALPAYPLPPDVRDRLLTLAAQSDVLIFGEMHGTREVPRLVASLLPDLAQRGYQGLTLEIPADVRDTLIDWAENDEQPLPAFFAAPSFDGRGNAETLALVRTALRPTNGAGAWQLLCFDKAAGEPSGGWPERDAAMARNLAEQQSRFCPGGKVLAVCGNLHSRLVRRSRPDHFSYLLWPSFAAALAEQNSALFVRSVNLAFHAGTFYNVAVRTLSDPNRPPLPAPFLAAEPESEHSLELHLPRATAATFLATPSPPPEETI